MAQLKVRYLAGVQDHHPKLVAFWILTAAVAGVCAKVTANIILRP
jgi:hypothetical protein